MPLKKWTDYTVNLMLAVLMSFSLVYTMTASLSFDFSPAVVIAIIVSLLLFLSLIFLNSLTVKITGAAAGAVLAACTVYILIKGVPRELIARLFGRLYSPIVWVTDYIYGVVPLDSTYELYILVYLCIGITLPVFFAAVKKFNFYILLAGGAAVFVIQWALEYIVSLVPFYLFSFTILMYYVRHIYKRKIISEPNEYAGQGLFVLLALPFCAVVVAIALLIPARENPVEWNWLDTRINQVFNYFNNRFKYEVFDNFSISSAGFGGSGSRLGGKVRLDKTPVLKVETPRMVYLKGSIRDYYTGSSWISSASEPTPLSGDGSELVFDAFELENGFVLLSGSNDFMDKYFEKNNIRVTYLNLITKSLFYPVKTTNFNLNTEKDVTAFIDWYGNLFTGKMMGKDYSYSFDSYSANLNDEDFAAHLRKSRRGLYRSVLDAFNASRRRRYSEAANIRIIIFTGQERRFISVNKENLEKLAEYSGLVYEKYLQLPDNFPDRIRQLASSIAGSQKNNYDRVKAIESYLSQNFTYTLSPRPTPVDRDFADFFLFDSKEGYCTYFATAMTVMARSLGIPARYVEGYMLPPKPEDGNVYYVTNEQAHAWVEVYLEGFGWLPVEPTSPFRASFYSSSEMAAGSFAADFAGDPYYLDYFNRMMEYNDGYMDIPELDLTDSDQEPDSYLAMYITGAAAAFLLFLFLCILLVNKLKRKVKLKRIYKALPRKSVLEMYKHMVEVLKIQNMGIAPGETPVQYSERVDARLFIRPLTFKSITEIFILARYSAREISEEQKRTLYDFYETFAKAVKYDMGKFKFFIYRHLLGRV